MSGDLNTGSCKHQPFSFMHAGKRDRYSYHRVEGKDHNITASLCVVAKDGLRYSKRSKCVQWVHKVLKSAGMLDFPPVEHAQRRGHHKISLRAMAEARKSRSSSKCKVPSHDELSAWESWHKLWVWGLIIKNSTVLWTALKRKKHFRTVPSCDVTQIFLSASAVISHSQFTLWQVAQSVLSS